MNLTDKARDVLDGLLVSFEKGTVPEAIAHTMIPALDVPCVHWSFNNQILTFLAGTSDARGIRQWHDAGRWPKKGSKAFYILVPIRVRRKSDPDHPDEDPGMRLIGFKAMPVFRVEDTEGEPIEYPEVNPQSPPLLADVAEAWGLAVKYQGFIGGHYGSFSSSRHEITLATHDEMVFFHELAHAAHEKLSGKLKPGQDPYQEVTAELTAAAVLHLYGRKPNDGAAYEYIRHYAERAGNDVYKACLAVLHDVQRCLALILEQGARADQEVPGAAG